MKRILIAFLCCILICLQIIPCFAATAEIQTETNPDGSCFIIVNGPLEIIDAPSIDDGLKVESNEISSQTGGIRVLQSLIEYLQKIITALMRLFQSDSNQTVISKTKYIYYYSSDSNLLWSAQLTGKFAYSSTSARCTNAAFDFKAHDSNWKLDDYTCTEQNATASVTFSVVQKSLGVKLQTIEKTMTLTCDTNGNVT